eukprot:scaffold1930_cov346-Prasinococcus_capsulatus_cf.AAC.10
MATTATATTTTTTTTLYPFAAGDAASAGVEGGGLVSTGNTFPSRVAAPVHIINSRTKLKNLTAAARADRSREGETRGTTDSSRFRAGRAERGPPPGSQRGAAVGEDCASPAGVTFACSWRKISNHAKTPGRPPRPHRARLGRSIAGRAAARAAGGGGARSCVQEGAEGAPRGRSPARWSRGRRCGELVAT